MEKALKNRRGQKRAQIEKEKMEALKLLQKDYEDATDKERRNLEDLRGVIRNEESSGM